MTLENYLEEEINETRLLMNASTWVNLLKLNGSDKMNYETIYNIKKEILEVNAIEHYDEIKELLLDKLSNETYGRGPLGAERLTKINSNKCVACQKLVQYLNEGKIGRFMYIFDELIELAHEEREIRYIKEIMDILNLYNPLSDTMNYNQFTQFKKAFNTLQFLEAQFRNFDNFRDNQNNYDNMISIIKILQRTKNAYGMDLDIEFNFKLDYDEFDIIKENLFKEVENNIKYIVSTI